MMLGGGQESKKDKRGLIINKKKNITDMSKKTEIPRSDIFLDGEILYWRNQFDCSLVTWDCRGTRKSEEELLLS